MTSLTVTRDDDLATMTIEFSTPLEYKGGQIMRLDLHEPTARQVREAEKAYSSDAPWAASTAYELKLIGQVTGLQQDALDCLPIGAANIAAGFLHDFVEAGGDPLREAEDDTPPEPVTLTLDPPIKFAGQSYSELDLREPLASEIRKARQLMRTAGSLFENRRAQMQLVTAVSGLPAPVIDALPIRILNEAGRVLSRFTIAGRTTGKT